MKSNARLDLKASGRILLAVLVAAVPAVAMIQFDRLGAGLVNLIIGGLLFLGGYLTFAPILRAMDKQDIVNLRTMLCRTRIVAVLANPVFDYGAKLLSLIGRD